MNIANSKQFWSSRMIGEDPTTSKDDAFSGSGGSASDGYWVITNSTYTMNPATTANTMVTSFIYNTAPDSGAVIMSLDNGTKKIEVKSKGNNTELDLVGATTVTISDLDLAQTTDNPVPTIIRLTLDASGNAKLYVYDIIRNAEGNDAFYSVVGASSSSAGINFGNTSGSIKWGSVYVSKFGAFNPEELMLSDFAQDALVRMGLSIVNQIQNSNRMYLKTQVPNSSIIYGYDLSSNMTNRISPPTIHVLLGGLDNGEFDTLGGSTITQDYTVDIFVTTKDTNYENAYRSCFNILGEVFDELYTNTGLSGTTDSITGFSTSFDTKMDNDETICVHTLRLNYIRRIKMTHR